MQVFLVRHGQTQWNLDGLLQGSSDIPLTDVGREQAQAAASALLARVGHHPVIVSSPLQRARDTAEVLARRIGASLHTDDRLRERSFGIWEGLTMHERQSRWPDEYAAWKNYGDPMLPGFEARDAVWERMLAGINDWADIAERDNRTLVVFAHGSCLRIGIHALLGLPLSHRTIGNLGNTAWSLLTRRSHGDWTLERHHVTAATVAAQ